MKNTLCIIKMTIYNGYNNDNTINNQITFLPDLKKEVPFLSYYLIHTIV